MKNMLFCVLLSWLSQQSLMAQNQWDWLIKQSEFEPVLASHLKEVKSSRVRDYPNVSIVLLRPATDSLTIYINVISYMSEAKKHLPSSFTTIQGQPFLVYDGSELLIENKEKWFETVRVFIGKRLCDDLEYLRLLNQPGPNELRVPCNFIYEPPIEKLVFKDGKLIRRTAGTRIPYYSE